MSNLAVEAAFSGSRRLREHPFKRVLRRVELRVGEDRGTQRLSLSSAGHVYKREGASDRQQASEATEERSLRVAPDQLVVNPMWLTGGSIAVSDVEGAVSPDYRVFDPHGEMVHARYLHHLLRSQPYRDQYNLYVRANTTFDRRIQQEDLDQLPLWLPDLDDQRRIADFLDDHVARIDQIIAARQTQRHHVAQSTVARLQELQDEWTRRYGETRLGRVLVGLEQGWSPQAEATEAGPDEWGVMRAGCVNDGIFREHDNKRLPEGTEPQRKYELDRGDLLMSRASGSLDKIGSTAVVPAEVRSRLLLCDKVYRLRLAPGWEAHFIAPMLRTHKSRQAIRLGVSGAEGMANNLPSGVIRSLNVPLLSEDRQADCALAAATVENQGRDAERALVSSIDLLSEYKQSLITAAVTGELDVTTAGSGIPG